MLSPFLTISMFPLYPNCIPMFSQYPYYVPTGSPLFSPDVPIIFPLRNSLCSSAIPWYLHENPLDVRTIHISIFPLHPCHFPIFPQHALNVRIWGFPEIGVPPVIISFQWDFPLQKKQLLGYPVLGIIQLLGYPHFRKPPYNFKVMHRSY